jgi:hypothetical protein
LSLSTGYNFTFISLKFDISEVKSCAEINPAEHLIAPVHRVRGWCAVPAQGPSSGATNMPQRRGWCAPISTEAQAKGLPEGSKGCQSIEDHPFHIFPWITPPLEEKEIKHVLHPGTSNRLFKSM